jgi:hypothetical protein
MDGTGDHHVKQNNRNSERQISHIFSPTWNLDLKKKKRHECKSGTVGRESMGGRGNERVMEG